MVDNLEQPLDLTSPEGGYRRLGFTDADFPAPGSMPGPNDALLFARGMKAAADGPRPFVDPPVSEWEPTYRRDDLHLTVLLADDDRDRLHRSLTRLRRSLDGVLTELVTEYGAVLRRFVPSIGFLNGPAPVAGGQAR